MTSIFWLALLIASFAVAILVTTWADGTDDLYTQDQSQDDEEEINWP